MAYTTDALVHIPHNKNGIAERKHKHIVDMGLTLLAQSHLPYRFWDDVFTTAVYLINRIPAKTLHYKTPLETCFNTKPNYLRLRTFGCLCYPYLRPFNKNKLSFRTESGVFLGYSPQYKGYKVLLSNARVIISRDVTFNELRFPYSTPTKDNVSNSHNYTPVSSHIPSSHVCHPHPDIHTPSVNPTAPTTPIHIDIAHSNPSSIESSNHSSPSPIPIHSPNDLVIDLPIEVIAPVTTNLVPMVTRSKAAVQTEGILH